MKRYYAFLRNVRFASWKPVTFTIVIKMVLCAIKYTYFVFMCKSHHVVKHQWRHIFLGANFDWLLQWKANDWLYLASIRYQIYKRENHNIVIHVYHVVNIFYRNVIDKYSEVPEWIDAHLIDLIAKTGALTNSLEKWLPLKNFVIEQVYMVGNIWAMQRLHRHGYYGSGGLRLCLDQWLWLHSFWVTLWMTFALHMFKQPKTLPGK